MRLQKSTILQAVSLLALAIAATLLIAWLGLDLALSSRYYVPPEGWPLTENQPWRFLYRYGNWFAHAITITSLAALLLGLVWKEARKYRREALYFAVVALVGPGLIVNYVFKAEWGRARPRNVVEFGGKSEFTHPWQPRDNPKGNSFPSGHASYAFFLVSPYFVLRKRKPAVARAFLCGGVGYGVLMGAARIVQGAHFLSDVLWSGTIVYLSAAIVADLIPPEGEG